MRETKTARRMMEISAALSAACEKWRAPPPLLAYNPLQYAAAPHKDYLKKFGGGKKRALFLGINPGPWGMAQTGVPFGEVRAVRDWMGVGGAVQKPENEHPRRPVLGFACPRSEPSGARLWKLFAARHQTAARFFADNFVWNYCPLLLSLPSRGGGFCNFTPDRLPAEKRRALEAACNRALAETVAALSPRFLVGVGVFAEKKLREVCGGGDFVIGKMPHPSPASPAANKNFAALAEDALRKMGVWVEEEK